MGLKARPFSLFVIARSARSLPYGSEQAPQSPRCLCEEPKATKQSRRLPRPDKSELACMKMLWFVNYTEFSNYFYSFHFFRHISLQTVSPDACIRHRGGCMYSPSWWHEHLPGGVALNERVQNLSCEARAYLLSDERFP